jgi:hypothetical protein
MIRRAWKEKEREKETLIESRNENKISLRNRWMERQTRDEKKK